MTFSDCGCFTTDLLDQKTLKKTIYNQNPKSIHKFEQEIQKEVDEPSTQQYDSMQK